MITPRCPGLFSRRPGHCSARGRAPARPAPPLATIGGVVALVLLPVVAFVWIARRVRLRREERALAARAVAEAEAVRLEDEILADLEARFNEA